MSSAPQVSSYRIEALENHHFPLVHELVEERIQQEGLKASFYWPYDYLFSELLAARGFVLLDSQDQVLAFILYRDLKYEWEISCLTVAWGYERQGFMKALIGHLLTSRKFQPLTHDIKVYLEVHESNRAAQSLYETMGFVKTAERKAYYKDGAAAFVYLA